MCNFGMVRRENFSPPPPPVANISGCPFQYPKVPLEAGAPPPIFWCFLRPWPNYIYLSVLGKNFF
jgi:hypothetical protein